MELRDRLQSTLGSAYSVERELGGGGMSRVFLAEETALHRKVVVKVLSGDLVAGISTERFAREVRLAASLQHPNIVPVLTTGVADGIPYYTMPYVKGESLRSRLHQPTPLPPRQQLSVLRDIARALDYAHSEGVIHRDIKPDNVLLAHDSAVVTDFGIAKAISAARTSPPDGSEREAPTTLTQAGSSIGTPAYMSPEQIAGDALDNRTDIYSWGVLAYELLSGEHPFGGRESAAQVMGAHISVPPPPLNPTATSIPRSVTELVMRCLAKVPDDRPSSAAQLIEGLDVPYDSRDRPSITTAKVKRPQRHATMVWGLAISAAVLVALGAYALFSKLSQPKVAAQTSSVAVLPFVHEQSDSTEAYFGEGIADELMTALGKVPGLRVASRTSAIAVGRRGDLDVREIAQRLGVSTVVEGTVRRSGGKLRVTAQLTNASDGLTMWSDAFDRETKDVFAVQDDITTAIVAALRPGDTQSAARKGPGTSDPEAYDLYMRGLYLLERRGPGVARSVDYFSQAIQKDPNFARAHAGLASALEFFPYFTGVPAHRVEPRVRAAAERALELDPSLAEPKVALAMAYWHALKWDEADLEFRKAITSDSTSSVARTQYGRYLIGVARVNDGVKELRIARRLDPLAATSSVWLSQGLEYAGDHAASVAESRRSRELDPNLITNRTVLVLNIVRNGKFREALSIIGDNIPPIPFDGMTAHNLERAGDKARAATIRKSLEAMPDTTWLVHAARTWGYLSVGDTAKALTEMEAAVDSREIIAMELPFTDYIYDPVRKSPRFAVIVKRLGLDRRGLTSPGGGRPGR